MRQLTVAFLLLLGNGTNGRARIPVHRHHSPHPGVAAANHSALLAATPVRPVQKDVDTAPAPLLASEASLRDRRVQPAPAPTGDSLSSCACELTTGHAARPPPFQA